MKAYTIRDTGETMVISERDGGAMLAEYRLTPGCERQEIGQMRRALNKHMATPGATLHNYQW